MSPAPSKPSKQHLILCRPGFSEALALELKECFAIEALPYHPAAVQINENLQLPDVSMTVFGRQVLPRAVRIESTDPAEVASLVVDRLLILMKRNNRGSNPWTLHAFASDDDEALAHALKIEKVIKNLIRTRHLDLQKRYVDLEAKADELEKAEANAKTTTLKDKESKGIKSKDPMTGKSVPKTILSKDSNHDVLESKPLKPKPSKKPVAREAESLLIIQVWAENLGAVHLSIATQDNGVVPSPGGVQRMRKIPGAPSRSASKLAEALWFSGFTPMLGSSGIDLGAAPGGWTYVMAYHGVHMTAVDHAALELPTSRKLKGTIKHLKENGLKYVPPAAGDWLLCDMVVGATQTLEVLSQWLAADRMSHFIVNIKLPQDKPWPSVKKALALLESHGAAGRWKILKARHLYHDRNEITLMGSKTLNKPKP
ncbi:MAG: hypothetical protein NTV34_14845 [Proteobacteria bacterium]|nr:hypothetical protein [Pseudomonadota bacterium]